MITKTVVTTCERKQPTLDRTLRSLQNAGVTDITVEYDHPFPGESKRGVVGQWLHAAKQCIVYNRGYDAILMCQDDIVVARGLGEALKWLKWPSDDYGCLSLYTPSKYAGGPHGWISYDGSYAWGACCLLFRAFDFPYFVAALENFAHYRGRSTGLDALIGEVLENSTLQLKYHNPSLVQHIGETSTISNESASGWRRASNFVGEDFTEIVWP